MQSFSDALLNEILRNKKNNYIDNYDAMMKFESDYQHEDKPKNIFAKLIHSRLPLTNHLSERLSIKRSPLHILKPTVFYKTVAKKLDYAAFLYSLLGDQQSKNLLVKILAYAALGYKKVKLPRNTPLYWYEINQLYNLKVANADLIIDFMKLNLILMDLAPIGFNLKLNSIPQAAACIFTQKQYEYRGKDIVIKAEKDDVVMDCGACWGDTALYFAHEVGNNGKVYAFEFLADNIHVFKHNIEHNPHLADSIQIVEHPVWHTSNENLYFSNHGPGTHISETPDSQSNMQVCQTITIDDLVEREQLKRVDFIKMDIEGSELSALKGAEKTIRRFKPKLAISAYHKHDDFITLPSYLHGLNLGYKFYLEHHTIHKWETVLFAVAE